MKAYKGFNKDMTCLGFQYEIGKEYETDNVELCKSGFHACEYPLDCLSYYAPNESIYCEVEQSGTVCFCEEDTKAASSKIKIGTQVSIKGLVDAAVEFVKGKATQSGRHHTRKKQSANSSTGYRSANSSTGYRSANSSTGDGSANSSTGYGSANLSTGCNSTNVGDVATLNAAWGKDSKCKGSVGAYLVLSEWGAWDGEKYPLIGATMILVDNKKIKADTWYTLIGGKIIEAE